MCLDYFFDMLSLGVCIARHWQASGRLVQELNVCTVAVRAGSEPARCLGVFSVGLPGMVHEKILDFRYEDTLDFDMCFFINTNS